MHTRIPDRAIFHTFAAGIAVCLVALGGCSSCGDAGDAKDLGDAVGDQVIDGSDTPSSEGDGASEVEDAANGDTNGSSSGTDTDAGGVDGSDIVEDVDDGDSLDTDDGDDASGDTDVDADVGGDVDADGGATCGDGQVEGSEACDDGNTKDGDYCSADCRTVTGSCGDGTLQSNESCDDGEITSNCDTYHDGGDGTCRPPGQCSSGYVWDGNKCVSETADQHVHIYISNTCDLSVQPKSMTLRNGRVADVTYHNHSSSYSADVVYAGGGGGYYDLMPGQSWNSPVEWCGSGGRPYTVSIDITVHGFTLNDSTCPGHRFEIHCK